MTNRFVGGREEGDALLRTLNGPPHAHSHDGDVELSDCSSDRLGHCIPEDKNERGDLGRRPHQPGPPAGRVAGRGGKPGHYAGEKYPGYHSGQPNVYDKNKPKAKGGAKSLRDSPFRDRGMKGWFGQWVESLHPRGRSQPDKRGVVNKGEFNNKPGGHSPGGGGTGGDGGGGGPPPKPVTPEQAEQIHQQAAKQVQEDYAAKEPSARRQREVEKNEAGGGGETEEGQQMQEAEAKPGLLSRFLKRVGLGGLPSRETLEHELAHNKPRSIEKIGVGISGAQLVHLKGDLAGVFKYDMERSGADLGGEDWEAVKADYGVESGSFWQREVAASKAANILGLGDLVPITVGRQARGFDGSIQQFVKGSSPLKLVKKLPDFWEENHLSDPTYNPIFGNSEELAKAAALDYFFGSQDRHTENWLVQEGGKLSLIDNSVSFADNDPRLGRGTYSLLFRKAAASGGVVPASFVGAYERHWPTMKLMLEKHSLGPKAVSVAEKKLQRLSASAGRSFKELVIPSPPPTGAENE